MKQNKGFTLVELLVAMAVFAILSVGVIGFMTTGMRTYRAVNTSVTLQTQAQIIMSQLREYLIDCDSGLALDAAGKQLAVVNKDSGGKYHSVQVIFNDTNKSVQLQPKTELGSGVTGFATTGLVDMANNATKLSFKVEAPIVEKREDTTGVSGANKERDCKRATQIKVELTLEKLGKTYTETQTIALRNKPLYRGNGEIGELYTDITSKLKE